MTNPASVTIPLDLATRLHSYIDSGVMVPCVAGREELIAELAALLPKKPDRAREVWLSAMLAWQNGGENDAVAIIRAELDAPRVATPEVADLIARLKDAEYADRGHRSATACLQAAKFLAAQFEVKP